MAERNGPNIQKTAAIVGGGLAGLTAALSLARRGCRVTVFERSRNLGGRARSTIEEGYVFNLGPHALYRTGAAARNLAKMGIPLSGRVPVRPGCVLRSNRLFLLPTSLAGLVRTRALTWPEKWELAQFFGRIQNTDPSGLQSTAVSDWLETKTTRLQVRAFIRALIRLTSYANAPDLQSAGAALEQVQLGLRGNVLYLDGGWQSLVAGLRDAAEKAGVVFQVGRKIRQVVGDADRATGVRDDDGNSFCADAVMLAVGPSEAAELIPSAWNAQVRRFSERAKPVKAACLDLALRRLPKPDRTFVLGLDAPLYFSVHSGIARPGPPGGSMIHAAFYQPCGSEAADAREQLERMLDNVQPGWREQQIYSRFLPNVTVASALDSSNDGGKNGRPSERALARHGLYLAGDWVGAEGMLADASVASAVAAADAVLSEVPSQINSGTIYA